MELTLDGAVLEALSWQLASGLVRRHPDWVVTLEHGHGGGLYDLLAVRAPTGTAVLMNRNGRVHVETDTFINAVLTWPDVLTYGLRHAVERIETSAGLVPTKRFPQSTKRVLVYRALAGVTTMSWLSERPAISMHRTVHADNRSECAWLTLFPGLPEALADIQSDARPSRDVWYVKAHGMEAAFVVETAEMFNRSGAGLQLSHRYQTNGRSMIRLLADVLEGSHT